MSVEPNRLVLGLNPVREAIRVHGRGMGRLILEDKPSPRLDAVARFAEDQGVAQIERISRFDLERLAAGAMHQGCAAFAPPLELLPWEPLRDEPTLLGLALDEVQDPQNFGAMIRSAVALARAPIIWGEHASAPLTPATFRASAGAIEHARLCRVRSLVGALSDAAAAGVRVVGLDAQAPTGLRQLDLTGPTILVVGSEGEGLGRAVRRSCTDLARLVKPHAVDSLNASVAAGIALYEAASQRVIPST